MRAVQDSNVGGDGTGGFAEQRRSWREPVVASGVLTAEGVGGGAAAQRVVRVVNLSEGGAGIIAAAPLGVGMEYRLEIAGRPEGSGRVRVVFCRPAHGGYEVGTHFIDRG
jgi:hypothetical protein